MQLTSRVRRLAAGKVRVRITRRQRGSRFVVSGPDGQRHAADSKTEALQNLLARLRCWQPGEWVITAEAKRRE